MNTKTKESLEKKWAWEEASDAEFEARRRQETYYRIFRISGGARARPKKLTVYKFWAKSAKAALSVLKAYSKDHPGKIYYYSTSGYHIYSDGSRHDDFDDLLPGPKGSRGSAKLKDAHRKFAEERKRIYGAIKAFFGSLKTNDRHLRAMIDDFRFFLRHYDMVSCKSHQRSESWDINSAFIDLLDFNLPRLARKHHGAPTKFCEEAKAQLNESHHPAGEYSSQAIDLASTLWRKELEKLHLYVQLYKFYTDFCIIDKRRRDEVELYEKYKDTIPYLPGTYKELDGRKLAKLQDRYWKLLIAQFQKIGRYLWD